MEIDKLISYIKMSKKTVFFGGAGVSTASGLQDFRGSNGLYKEKRKYPPEEILSHTFFMKHPDLFYEFYKEKLNSLNYKPNIIHKTLKLMEDKNLLSSIITQNIDGFDKMAGSRNVLELHGSILRNYCLNCHKFYSGEYVFKSSSIPKCSCGGIVKPDVVLYEEALDNKVLTEAIKEVSEADLLIVGGTSLQVYPASSLVTYFRGKHLVLINKDETPYDYLADIVIHDDLASVFEKVNKSISLN